MTIDVKYHIEFIKSMSKYQVNALILSGHANHIYFSDEVLKVEMAKKIKECSINKKEK